jgi:hypothetical protein
MDSHFWDIIRDIRSLIHKPDHARFIVHTSIGAITVDRFVFRAEAGFVFLQGIDENGMERMAGFSEQQLSTFPSRFGRSATAMANRSGSIHTSLKASLSAFQHEVGDASMLSDYGLRNRGRDSYLTRL